MTRKHSSEIDQRLEFLIAVLLRVGVLVVAIFVLIGGAVFLFKHGMEPADYHLFRGEPANLRTINGIISEVFSFKGRSLIQLGLLILIMVPVSRVAVAGIAFYRQKDHLYVAVSLTVLTLLLYSLFSGIIRQ